MTPVNLVRHSSLELQFGGEYGDPVDTVDDSMSMDTQDIVDQPAISITEIAVSQSLDLSQLSRIANAIFLGDDGGGIPLQVPAAVWPSIQRRRRIHLQRSGSIPRNCRKYCRL